MGLLITNYKILKYYSFQVFLCFLSSQTIGFTAFVYVVFVVYVGFGLHAAETPGVDVINKFTRRKSSIGALEQPETRSPTAYDWLSLFYFTF